MADSSNTVAGSSSSPMGNSTADELGASALADTLAGRTADTANTNSSHHYVPCTNTSTAASTIDSYRRSCSSCFDCMNFEALHMSLAYSRCSCSYSSPARK